MKDNIKYKAVNDPRVRLLAHALTKKDRFIFRCTLNPFTRSELTVYWLLNGERFSRGMVNCRCVSVINCANNES